MDIESFGEIPFAIVYKSFEKCWSRLLLFAYCSKISPLRHMIFRHKCACIDMYRVCRGGGGGDAVGHGSAGQRGRQVRGDERPGVAGLRVGRLHL